MFCRGLVAQSHLLVEMGVLALRLQLLQNQIWNVVWHTKYHD